MAISTQINNTAYKRALDGLEKEKLAQIAQTQGAAAASSAYLQAMNQAQSAIAKNSGATPNVTVNLSQTDTNKNLGGAVSPATAAALGTPTPANDYQKALASVSNTDRNNSGAVPNLAAPTPAVQQKDYLLFGTQDPNFKVGMTDEDKASWNAIGQKYAAGDTSWNRDTNSFREDGNWSGYYDDNGNYNGWLMAVNGIGGYAPAFGGKVGETGYTPGTVFYAPDGVAYTMGADGSLTKSGNVTLAQYGSYIGPKAGYQDSEFWALNDNGRYQRYTNQTAPDSVLEAAGYYRDQNGLVMPIDEQYRMAQAVKNGEITPEQLAMAQAIQNAGPQNVTPQNVTPSVSSSGSTSRITRETTPTTVTPQQTQQQQTTPVQTQQITPVTSQNTNNQNIYQAYLDQWEYPEAPEWEGTEYQAKRDAALEAAGEKWTPSEYQQKRDDALSRAEQMQWNYDPNSDPVWQAYQKQYRREGDRATKEALAQASMRTGGLANSYAVTAASQAGDYYASQLSDKLPELYQDAYNRYLQEFQRQLGISDQYQGFDDREYSRWADQQGRNFDLADRYNQYGEQDYNKYRDRLSQYNTDRNFSYGQYRDAVGDYRYDDETAYNRNYQAQRDAINDQRYDQEWAQQLREYADSQGWKQKEWEQYLREYGDQLSEKERQWAYQMARDAVSDARYDQEYADSRADTAYSRALADEERAYNRAWNEDERDYERGWDATKWDQALREYDDEQAQQAWNNEYKLNSKSSSGSTGRSSGGTKTSTDTVTPASGKYDESGKRTDTWTDADGYTYSGYHADGQPKSQGYDKAWATIQTLAQSGASRENVLTRIRSLVERDEITDYEAEMMLVNLGYRTTSAGTGRNTIGPNNVQMVQ